MPHARCASANESVRPVVVRDGVRYKRRKRTQEMVMLRSRVCCGAQRCERVLRHGDGLFWHVYVAHIGFAAATHAYAARCHCRHAVVIAAARCLRFDCCLPSCLIRRASPRLLLARRRWPLMPPFFATLLRCRFIAATAVCLVLISIRCCSFAFRSPLIRALPRHRLRFAARRSAAPFLCFMSPPIFTRLFTDSFMPPATRVGCCCYIRATPAAACRGLRYTHSVAAACFAHAQASCRI